MNSFIRSGVVPPRVLLDAPRTLPLSAAHSNMSLADKVALVRAPHHKRVTNPATTLQIRGAIADRAACNAQRVDSARLVYRDPAEAPVSRPGMFYVIEGPDGQQLPCSWINVDGIACPSPMKFSDSESAQVFLAIFARLGHAYSDFTIQERPIERPARTAR